MPAIAFCELCEVDRKKQIVQWQSKLPVLPRKRYQEFAEVHGEDAVQEIVNDSWLVDRDGLPACVACPCFSTDIGTLGVLRKHAEATLIIVDCLHDAILLKCEVRNHELGFSSKVDFWFVS